MKKERKNIRFNMLMDTSTIKKLEVIAQEAGKSQAAVIRELIIEKAITRPAVVTNEKQLAV